MPDAAGKNPNFWQGIKEKFSSKRKEQNPEEKAEAAYTTMFVEAKNTFDKKQMEKLGRLAEINPSQFAKEVNKFGSAPDGGYDAEAIKNLTDVAVNNPEKFRAALASLSVKEGRPEGPLGTETREKLTREQIIALAQNLLEEGLRSSYLKPDAKHESIADYLKKELAVEVDIDNLNEIDDFDEIDKLIIYKWQDSVKKQGQKFLKKTVVSGGTTLAVGGVLGLITGGTAWAVLGAGMAGSAGGRLVVEGLKAGFDIWGKGKKLRLEVAKNYLAHAMEAQEMARDLIENSNDPEKFWQAAGKLVDFVYASEKGATSEGLKKVSASQEELKKYENKWNTAEEIVSLAGGIGTAAAYGLTRGAETILAKKVELAAHRGIEINLDGKGIGHAVEKVNGVWHHIIKQADITQAMHDFPKHWAQYLHQVGGKVAEAGTAHASVLSESVIQEYLAKQVFKEMAIKILPSVVASLFVGNAVSWGLERQSISKELGISSEDAASKELIKKKYGKVIEAEAAKYKKDLTTEPPAPEATLTLEQLAEKFTQPTPQEGDIWNFSKEKQWEIDKTDGGKQRMPSHGPGRYRIEKVTDGQVTLIKMREDSEPNKPASTTEIDNYMITISLKELFAYGKAEKGVVERKEETKIVDEWLNDYAINVETPENKALFVDSEFFDSKKLPLATGQQFSIKKIDKDTGRVTLIDKDNHERVVKILDLANHSSGMAKLSKDDSETERLRKEKIAQEEKIRTDTEAYVLSKNERLPQKNDTWELRGGAAGGPGRPKYLRVSETFIGTHFVTVGTNRDLNTDYAKFNSIEELVDNYSLQASAPPPSGGGKPGKGKGGKP